MTPTGGKQAPAQVTGSLTKAAPDKWAGCSFRAVQALEKSLRLDLLVFALYLIFWFWLFLHKLKRPLPAAAKTW